MKYISRNRKTLICTALLLILLGGILFTLEKTGKIHLFTGSQGQTKQQEARLNQTKKAATANNPSIPTASNPNPKGTTPGSTYTPPTTSNNIQLTAQKTSDSQVTVITKLYGYSDGTCSLEVTNGTHVNKQVAKVIFQPEYSTCAGFNVPISSLGTGQWNISLTVSSGGSNQTKSIVFGVD